MRGRDAAVHVAGAWEKCDLLVIKEGGDGLRDRLTGRREEEWDCCRARDSQAAPLSLQSTRELPALGHN